MYDTLHAEYSANVVCILFLTVLNTFHLKTTDSVSKTFWGTWNTVPPKY